MRNCIVYVFILAIYLTLVTGCRKNQPSVSPSFSPPELAEGRTSETQILGRTIIPLPSTIDINALNNCSVAAGFEAKDVYLEDWSRLVIHFTVYDCEFFDMVDITQMKAGDTLVIGGESILVNTIDMGEFGVVSINGGYENGGVWLTTPETGAYYQIQENDARVYSAVGEVTIPVAQEFLFHDASDITEPEKIIYPGDMIMDMQNNDRVFLPEATTVTIREGKIISLSTVYIP